jgi:hypothetical protein
VPFPFDPFPDTLWTLTNGEKLSCEIAFVPIGVKATVMRNGKLLYSRIFATGDEATAWAEEERKGHLAKGWCRLQLTDPPLRSRLPPALHSIPRVQVVTSSNPC